MEKIFEKENELKELKSRIPFKLLKGEKLMSLIFISDDNDIHYSIICKNVDIFNLLENKIYNKYPKYKEIETYFMINDKKVNRFKNIEENNIKDNDIITLKIK